MKIEGVSADKVGRTRPEVPMMALNLSSSAGSPSIFEAGKSDVTQSVYLIGSF